MEPPRSTNKTSVSISKLHSVVLTALAFVFFNTPVCAEVTDQISQYGITWSFSERHESGQFANGDYWVVGPVNIVGIDPPSIERVGTTTLGGFVEGGDDPRPRTMHGSMVNPVTPPKGELQNSHGFDSEMYLWHPTAGRLQGKTSKYIPSLNVALGVNESNPLVLPPNTSLVSVISHENGGRPQLKTAAILTVLPALPPNRGATSFRPPYSGTEKPLYSVTALRKDLLPQLALVEPLPEMDKLIAQFQRPWIDHFGHLGDGTQFTSPSENMPNYGREYSVAVGNAALMLMLNEQELVSRFQQNKDALLIRFVQLGIDLYHVTENGGYWWGVGGLNHGRKWPIIFAGLMLGNERMKSIGARSKEMPYWGFAEDAQTKHLEASDIALTQTPEWKPDARSGPPTAYSDADIGMPEWCVGGWAPGLAGASTANRAARHLYRDINGMSYPGLVLPALLMGQKPTWNHDALFDYTDRYVAWMPGESPQWTEAQMTQYVFGGAFQRAMWEAYRAQAGSAAR